MAKNPADVAAKWSRNLAGAQASISAGVMAVTQNPAQKAAAQAQAYLQGVQQSVASGKYQRGLGRVTLQSWQEAMLKKGLPRIASGASQGQSKMQNFLDKWLPYQDQLKQKLANMPRGDLQSNIARAVAAIEHNANFQYTG